MDDIGSARFVRSGACVTRDIAGETLVVPVRRHAAELDSIFTLNGVGAVIWRRLDGAATVADIAAAVCGEFEVPLGEAESDVVAFVARLRELGLVEPAGAGPR